MTNVEALTIAMNVLIANQEGERGRAADLDRIAIRRIEKLIQREERIARRRANRHRPSVKDGHDAR